MGFFGLLCIVCFFASSRKKRGKVKGANGFFSLCVGGTCFSLRLWKDAFSCLHFSSIQPNSILPHSSWHHCSSQRPSSSLLIQWDRVTIWNAWKRVSFHCTHLANSLFLFVYYISQQHSAMGSPTVRGATSYASQAIIWAFLSIHWQSCIILHGLQRKRSSPGRDELDVSATLLHENRIQSSLTLLATWDWWCLQNLLPTAMPSTITDAA